MTRKITGDSWPYPEPNRAPPSHSTCGRPAVLSDALVDKVRAAGCIPVTVYDDTNPEDSDGLAFVGSFDEFLALARELQVRAVFVSVRTFTEGDFAENREHIASEVEASPQRVNAYLAELDLFKGHFGKVCERKASLRTPSFVLNYFESEDWWTKYSNKVEEALEGVAELVATNQQALEAAATVQREAVLAELKALLRDDEFLRLPTQRAMIEYAREGIDNIDLLDESELKAEIQRLNDRAVARGLKKN